MGEGIESDPHGHALLVLRAVRAGVLVLDERARHYVFEGETKELGLYTDDGSCLSTPMARRIRAAIERAEDAEAEAAGRKARMT